VRVDGAFGLRYWVRRDSFVCEMLGKKTAPRLHFPSAKKNHGMRTVQPVSLSTIVLYIEFTPCDHWASVTSVLVNGWAPWKQSLQATSMPHWNKRTVPDGQLKNGSIRSDLSLSRALPFSPLTSSHCFDC
jgi:hypothetical protein